MVQSPLRNLVKFLLPYKLQITVVAISLTIVSALILSFGIALKLLVDQGTGNVNDLKKIAIYCIFIGIGISIGSFLRSYHINSLCEKVISDIRLDAYKNLIDQPTIYFEIQKTSDLVSRLTNDTLLISNIIADLFSFTIRNCLMAIGGIILMFNVSAKLTLIMLGVIVVSTPLIILFGRKVRALARKTQENIAALTADIDESFSAVKTIQAFNSQQLRIDNFTEIAQTLLKNSLLRFKYRSTFFSVVIMVIISIMITILWLGVNDIINGVLTSGELISFLYFAVQTSISIGGVSDILSEIQRAFAAMERVFALNMLPKNLEQNIKYIDFDNYNINFNKVDCIYPTRPENKVLYDFNLQILQGNFVGIVGISGSGKSTLFQILLNFLSINNGNITIGQHDIAKIPSVQLREILTIVPQDPYIFSDTVRANILFSKPLASEAELIEAARAAGIYDYIMSLPEKFETFLGEKAVRLSGGQKQRIAIARALLRKPTILLLDEATSALDSTNELQIIDSIKSMMQGRTVIAIAHRIHTVKDCDKIYVIDKGQVVAEGQHEQLLQISNLYRELNYNNIVQ